MKGGPATTVGGVSDAFLSPGRIGWVPAVAATLLLIALGEAARIIAWARDDEGHHERFVAWSLPGHSGMPSPAVVAGYLRVKMWLRPAAVVPLAFAPVPLMRPPADMTTAVVVGAVVWWTLFTIFALVGGQLALRSAR